jgi:hypothetical protein
MLSSCGSDDDTTIANGALTLSIANLGTSASNEVYEGWIIVAGAPISTGTFTIDAQGAWSANTFTLPQVSLDAATKFVLTVEPSGETGTDAATPSALKILAGDFSNKSAAISTNVAPANLGDFSNVSGSYFLRTPTDEAPGSTNNGNDQNGIWFGIPGTMPPAPGLASLPTLPSGWAYEGWVVTSAGPISTGTFTAFDTVDSGNPFSGTANNAGPPIPGEDFFNAAPTGQTFPLDLKGTTVVISIEPVPDNSPSPFFLKPLIGMIPTDALTAPEVYTIAAAAVPSGTASF